MLLYPLSFSEAPAACIAPLFNIQYSLFNSEAPAAHKFIRIRLSFLDNFLAFLKKVLYICI
jgi:hypothetical protein